MAVRAATRITCVATSADHQQKKEPASHGDTGLSKVWELRAQRGSLRCDRGLAVGSLVLVDDALARGLVESARGLAGVLSRGLGITGSSSLTEAAHSGLERRAGRLVALASQLIRTVALDLRLDIRHGALCLFVAGGRSGRVAPAQAPVRLLRIPAGCVRRQIRLCTRNHEEWGRHRWSGSASGLVRGTIGGSRTL